MRAPETVFLLALLGTVPVAAPLPWPTAARRAIAWLKTTGWPVLVYVPSRLAIVLAAGLDALITRRSLAGELSLFDGQWYLRLASHGYPDQPCTSSPRSGSCRCIRWRSAGWPACSRCRRSRRHS